MISEKCNIDIVEKDNKIVVKIAAPLYDPLKVSRIRIETHNVVDHLKQSGVIFGKCIQENSLYNKEKTEGTWIFEKKFLDKSPEKVILTKEKKPAPKNKSRAKKKTSK